MPKSSSRLTPEPVPEPPRRVRVTLRDLSIVLLSAGAGIGSTLLLINAHVPFGQAVLGGCASFGATFYFLDRIID